MLATSLKAVLEFVIQERGDFEVRFPENVATGERPDIILIEHYEKNPEDPKTVRFAGVSICKAKKEK